MSHNYLLRLDQPDGSHAVLQLFIGQLPGCTYVTDGTSFWADPEGLLDLLKQAWVDQRVLTNENVVIAGDLCRSNNSLMDVDTLDITHAVI